MPAAKPLRLSRLAGLRAAWAPLGMGRASFLRRDALAARGGLEVLWTGSNAWRAAHLQVLSRPMPSARPGLARAFRLRAPAPAKRRPSRLGAGALGILPVQAQPFLIGGGIAAGTWGLYLLAKAGLERWAKAHAWPEVRLAAARRTVSFVIWNAGLSYALLMAGASPLAVLGTFSVFASFAFKQIISNTVQAVVLLKVKPFRPDEMVKSGDVLLKLADLSIEIPLFREAGRMLKEAPALVEEGYEVVSFGSVDPLGRESDDKGNRFVLRYKSDFKGKLDWAPIPYAKLAGQALTVLRSYTPPSLPLDFKAPALRQSAAKALRAAWDSRGAALGWTFAWSGLSLASAAALNFWALPFAWAALAQSLGADFALLAAQAAQPWARGLVSRLAGNLGWAREKALLVKLFAEILPYAAAGVAVLRFFDLGWYQVMGATLGAASLLSFISGDALTNLAEAFWIRRTLRIRKGEEIKVNSERGTVLDINWLYLVLGNPDQGFHTLIPLGTLKSADMRMSRPIQGAE